jgi:glycosyltransferase involved in cell wall biosynthesis
MTFYNARGMLLLCCLVFLSFCVSKSHETSYNIALHAQVYPEDKIVGSVITTDGLRAAFLKRAEIGACEIFYPGHYRGFSDVKWDFLIIEGWFLSIHEFIQVSRDLFPNIKIFFYCLDPFYPGLSVITKLNVDGIATNSRRLKSYFQSLRILTEYIMLAADPDVMQPLIDLSNSTQRSCNLVYVGAGSHMIREKPELLDMLLDAIPFNLRIYGAGWEYVRELAVSSLGFLPRGDLAKAYSSAEIVLASTIKTQDDFGMINNRIFEAMACGSVVVSQYSTSLFEVFGNKIIYRYPNTSFKSVYEDILSNRNSEERADLRHIVRNEILAKHTWEHRVLQFLDFMKNVKYSKSLRATTNKLSFLWIESKESLFSMDYLFLKSSFLYEFFHSRFNVTMMDEEEFVSLLHVCSNQIANCSSSGFISSFHVVFAVILPFSTLDRTMLSLPQSIKVSDKSQIQRRMGYFTGFDAELFRKTCSVRVIEVPSFCSSYKHYDIILFRDYYDIDAFEHLVGIALAPSRRQHVFGISGIDRAAIPALRLNGSVSTEVTSVTFICFFNVKELCSKNLREVYLSRHGLSAFTLVLVGGTMQDWLNGEYFSASDLKRVYFISRFSSGVDLLNILNQSSLIVIIHNESTEKVSTTEHVIFPFVLSCLNNGRLHLSHVNSHFIDLARQSCDTWDGYYLMNSTRMALNRLFGFPSALSSFSIRPLSLSLLNNSCENCNSHDWVILRECKVLSRKIDIKTMPYAVLSLENFNFDIGRDGQVCINNATATSDKQLCFLRPMEYVVITADPHLQSTNVELTLSIRGNVFGDFALSYNVSIELLPPSPAFNESRFFVENDKRLINQSTNSFFDEATDCNAIVYPLS